MLISSNLYVAVSNLFIILTEQNSSNNAFSINLQFYVEKVNKPR